MFSGEFYHRFPRTPIQSAHSCFWKISIFKNFIISSKLFSKMLGQLFTWHLPVVVFLFSIVVYNKLLSLKIVICSRIAWPNLILQQIPGYGMFSPTSISMFCSQSSKNHCFFNSHTLCNVQHAATMFTVFWTEVSKCLYKHWNLPFNLPKAFSTTTQDLLNATLYLFSCGFKSLRSA